MAGSLCEDRSLLGLEGISQVQVATRSTTQLWDGLEPLHIHKIILEFFVNGSADQFFFYMISRKKQTLYIETEREKE